MTCFEKDIVNLLVHMAMAKKIDVPEKIKPIVEMYKGEKKTDFNRLIQLSLVFINVSTKNTKVIDIIQENKNNYKIRNKINILHQP
eukprot:UN05720